MTRPALWHRISGWVQRSNEEVMIYDQDFKRYFLGSKVAEGGQGVIYTLRNETTLLYKEYFNPTQIQERKIEALVKLSSIHGHSALALPVSPVYIRKGILQEPRFTGFLMPNVKNADLLFSYMHPEERRQRHPEITTRHMYVIAHNIAYSMEEIHAWKHTVIGDVNESNILVCKNLCVKWVDADSIQYSNGKVHRCEVGKFEYV